ncbi:MAG: replicative DNA helicase [Planctomycetota bacterium]
MSQANPLPFSNNGRSDRRPIELGKLFDKLPPHALEAEAALLGSMILDWRVCGDVLQILRGPEDFYNGPNAAIYQVLQELYDVEQSIDLVQLNQRLIDKGVLEQVGGADYLVELAEAVPSAANASYYAKIVREKALLRQLIESAGRTLHDCYHSDEPAVDLLDKVSQGLFQIQEHRGDTNASELSRLLEETYEKLENHDGRLITGLESGFFELDEMTNGLQPGEMIIIAARPSMGKTAFMLNIAEHCAASNKLPVAVFSLEMSKQQLAQRLLCSRSGVDSHKLRRNMLGADDFQKLSLTVGELSDAPMFIDDTPGLSLMALRAKARRLAMEKHIKAVFIDYMQLMSCPGSESRQQEVSELSRGIKALARELNVPVVCLSQLNRQAEAREGHRPRMSDLRESGSIEQDADVVMMVHREDYFHKGDDEYEPTNIGEIIMAKQRNGPTGTVKLQFHGPTTRFHNLAQHQDNGFG